MDSLRQKLIGLINATKRKKPYRCEVEYIESTGTQYIDTGIDYFADFEVGIQLRNNVSNKALGNGASYCMQRQGAANPYWQFTNGGSAYSYNSPTPITEHHVMKWKDNKIYADNVLLTDFTKSLNEPNRMYLYSADGTNRYHNMIYFCKLWNPNNGEIVRDYIPVLDWNNKPALYDRVTGELFYNKNTSGDDFAYGREIHRVDYLESAEGAKQWIDTGYIVNTATDEIELDFQFISSTMYKWIFGDHYTAGKRLAIGSGDGEGKRNLAYGATTYKIADKYILNNLHHYNINSAGAYIDGDKLANYSSFTGDATLYLFNINIDSTADYTSSGRIWKYKHKRNGVYLRDMYPMIDENGVGAMFDRVTHTIFDNKGTGIGFKYPPVEVEYLESTGTQYINTGMISTANSKVDAEFSFTSMEGGVANNCGVFGGRNQPNVGVNTFVLFKIASGNPQYFRFDYNSQKTVGTAEQLTWNTNSKYRFQYDGANCITTNLTTGENVITENVPASSFTQQPIYLFCVNSAGARGNAMAGRIYKYWYTDGTNTIKLVPAIKDGKGCMYDKITGTVYANLGTDDFIVGKIKEK